MIGAVRMELIRFGTLRWHWVMMFLVVALNAVPAVIVARVLAPDPFDAESLSGAVTGWARLIPLPITAVLMGVLGASSVGQDYRHGLISPVLSAVPRRLELVAARLLVLVAVATGVTLLSVALNLALCALLGGPFPPLGADGLLQSLFGYLVLVILWAVLGAGAVWLSRSATVVLVALLVLPLVAEPMLQLISLVPSLSWLKDLLPWRPFSAGRAMLQAGERLSQLRELSPLAGGLEFAAVTAAVLAAGVARFTRRDA
jgi:ABC-2 type transport system permease protein